MSPYAKSLATHFVMAMLMAVFASVGLRLFIANMNVTAGKVGLKG